MAGESANLNWIQDLISETEQKQISEAIAHEEKKTKGEIVAMIVKRSSYFGHLPLALTLLMYVLFLVFEMPNHSFVSEQGHYWLILIAAIVMYLASFVLAKIDLFQRMFISRQDLVSQVEQRALLEFYHAGIQGTAGRTGILIFVSLFEKRVVVLADKTISDKLPKETWSVLSKDLVQNIKKKNTGQGFVQAIQACGQILQTHFPAEKHDINELPNQLIVKE